MELKDFAISAIERAEARAEQGQNKEAAGILRVLRDAIEAQIKKLES